MREAYSRRAARMANFRAKDYQALEGQATMRTKALRFIWVKGGRSRWSRRAKPQRLRSKGGPFDPSPLPPSSPAPDCVSGASQLTSAPQKPVDCGRITPRLVAGARAPRGKFLNPIEVFRCSLYAIVNTHYEYYETASHRWT